MIVSPHQNSAPQEDDSNIILFQVILFSFFFFKMSCMIRIVVMSEYPSPAKLLDARCSALWCTRLHSNVIFPTTFFTHAAPYQHTPTSMFHCWHYASHCGSPGQVHDKHAAPHLIQTNVSLFWIRLV